MTSAAVRPVRDPKVTRIEFYTNRGDPLNALIQRTAVEPFHAGGIVSARFYWAKP